MNLPSSHSGGELPGNHKGRSGGNGSHTLETSLPARTTTARSLIILPPARDAYATRGLLSVVFSTLLVDNVSVEVRAEAMAIAIFDSCGDDNEHFFFFCLCDCIWTSYVMGFVIQKNL